MAKSLGGRDMGFKGRTAMVTGGARGIGKAIATALAKGGADIAVADIGLPQAEETASELRGLGVKAIAIGMDVSSPADVARAFEAAVKELGRLDILVNNAGITKDSLLIRMKEEDWDSVLDINLKSVF